LQRVLLIDDREGWRDPAIPLLAIRWLPTCERSELALLPVLLALGLTGWFAAWVTGLPPLRMVVRNLVLGVCAMTAGLIIGHVVVL
jgi:VIT1/CCC1 family predicted Fe2+/Mn2+ transporter